MEDGLNLTIHENVFASSEEIFQRLEQEIDYLPQEQCKIRIRNKSYPIPRKIAAFGEPDLSYTFSGLTVTSQPWPSLLLEIKDLIQSLTGVNFNFVLINKYDNGNACIGQHKDDEGDLDENYPICSLSFGETRTMVFKRPGFKDKKIDLKSNSLLVMNPPTNKLWSHGIPKQKKRNGVRVNLTFRMMKAPGHNKRKHDEKEDIYKKIKAELPKEGILRENGKEWKDSLDMKYLGGENFLTVNHFLGQTRVHVRRYVTGEDGRLHPTKDGVSLSPKVWLSFCGKMNTILNRRTGDQVFVIDKDLCISIQKKDDLEVFAFQRLFQRQNLTMQFVPEHVVLTGPEFGKLVDNKDIITDRVKDGLITYTLSYYISEELDKRHMEIKPNNDSGHFLQLLDSLSKCLMDAITLKIKELLNCFGCRESYAADFMHACLTKSRSELWSDYSVLAFYSINMYDVAKDIVQRNLTIDFDFVLGQQEFFDALDVKKLLDSLEKMYVGVDESIGDQLMSCNFTIE